MLFYSCEFILFFMIYFFIISILILFFTSIHLNPKGQERVTEKLISHFKNIENE